MEHYKFNPITRTLVMSAGFARAISDIRSDEYNLYKQMLADVPDLKVERKTHEKPTSYKDKKNGKRTSYYPTKGLTYERMEQFMNALPEGQKYLDVYYTVRAVSGICPSAYASVRRWFEAQFPLYRNNPLFYVKNSVEVIDYATVLDKVA